jgi:signal transduction histidine kinase
MSAPLAVAGWLAALGCATAARVALARRMQLVERACHELRGPLASARLAVELAARRPGAPHAPLEAIDLELGRAGRALEDLDAARRGARAPGQVETFELCALLHEAVGAERMRAWQRHAQLTLDVPDEAVLVRGDRERLDEAVGNLLRNAVEHGGRQIVVRVRASAHTVRVEVLDDGPGLPAPVEALVRRPARDGHGHGLAIARDAAAAYGGRLACAPCARGARLVLELPTAPPDAR